MTITLLCDPPLGHLTTLHEDETLRITVVICSDEQIEQPLEVAIWYNDNDDQEWTAHPLSAQSTVPETLSGKLPGSNVASYSGALERSSVGWKKTRFTVKYRLPGADWKWANDMRNFGDAEIVYLPSTIRWGELSDYLVHTEESVQVETLTSDSGDTTNSSVKIWSLKATIPGSTGQSSGWRHMNLGLPLSISRWFCLARESIPWLCPRQGTSKYSSDKEAILISFQRDDGTHLVFLALSFDDVMTVIEAEENGELIAVARNERPVEGTANVLVAVARSWEEGVEAVVGCARKILERQTKESDNVQVDRENFDILPVSLERWYDSFAYCTWNGLGQDLTSDKIYEALETMKSKGVHFSTLIIDDNWQSLDGHGLNNFSHRLLDFEADRNAFPGGLKVLVSIIKQRFPYIRDIAVWHGIFGYWNGISPDGELAKRYKTKVLKKQDKGFFGGGEIIAVDSVDVFRFYDDFYRFLSESGVTAVKTDTQFLLDQLADAPDRASLITAYQSAWTQAHTTHFSGRAISCMSQTPHNLFSTQLLSSITDKSTSPKLMTRNSEDFFPDEPTSHPWHIFCNAHTNVLTHHLHILPDWDMFQTAHLYSSYHAAARCISGGPIYFTDKPGQHDINLINQITAIAPDIDGTRIILRPEVAWSREIYIGNWERRLLKVGTRTIELRVPMLGLFNVNEVAVAETLGLRDFPAVVDETRYIIRAHTTGKISKPMRIEDGAARFLVNLDVKGYEILTAYPLETISISGPRRELEVAVLGLMGKMTGAAAVVATKIVVEDKEIRVQVELKALGVLGIYISNLEAWSLDIITAKLVNVDVQSTCIRVLEESNVIKVDLEEPWNVAQKSADCTSVPMEISFRLMDKHQ